MNTVISNRIYVNEPTDEIVNWAKANLEFANPEYAKKERMGFWLGRTPKTLRMYEWNGKTLILPFGVCREIMPMLKGSLLNCDFRQDSVIDYGGKDMGLYPYQEEAVNRMIDAKYGILKAGCGSGKTQCGIAIIKKLRRRALWLCNKHDLLKQSMERAERYMDKSLFGTITAGQVDVGIGITFATVQTMSKLDLTHFRDYWDVIIVDECHGVAVSAETFTMYEKVLNHLAARRRYGLTATPHRADGLIKATFALIGKVMYEVPKEEIADRVTDLKVRVIPTETSVTDDCLRPDGMIDFSKLIMHIVTDETRNRMIAEKIMSEKGRSCIVLSDRLDQLKTIIGMLPQEMQNETVYIDGRMTSKKAKEQRETGIEQMRSGEKKYFFGSYKIAREGLDIPCLERLFMASPVKDEAVVEQSVGRIRRTSDTKTDVPIVYDFKDKNIGLCNGWYRKRYKVYRELEAEIENGR